VQAKKKNREGAVSLSRRQKISQRKTEKENPVEKEMKNQRRTGSSSPRASEKGSLMLNASNVKKRRYMKRKINDQRESDDKRRRARSARSRGEGKRIFFPSLVPVAIGSATEGETRPKSQKWGPDLGRAELEGLRHQEGCAIRQARSETRGEYLNCYLHLKGNKRESGDHRYGLEEKVARGRRWRGRDEEKKRSWL